MIIQSFSLKTWKVSHCYLNCFYFFFSVHVYQVICCYTLKVTPETLNIEQQHIPQTLQNSSQQCPLHTKSFIPKSSLEVCSNHSEQKNNLWFPKNLSVISSYKNFSQCKDRCNNLQNFFPLQELFKQRKDSMDV